MPRKGYYSPPLRRDLVKRLYFAAKDLRVPMTVLNDRLMEDSREVLHPAQTRRKTHAPAQAGVGVVFKRIGAPYSPGRPNSDGARRNISGNNTYGGNITLGSATRINSDSGTLTLNGTATITGASFGLTVGGAGNTTISSAIGTTSGILTKDGEEWMSDTHERFCEVHRLAQEAEGFTRFPGLGRFEQEPVCNDYTVHLALMRPATGTLKFKNYAPRGR